MGKFDRIFKFIQKGKLTLFVGAGFSLKAGAPSVSTLKEAFINEFPSEERDALKTMGLDEITERYVHQCCNDSRNEMNTILEREFSFKRGDLSDQELLAKIPHIKHVFTTNYDSLLEDTYGSRCQVIRHSTDATYLDENKVAIFKIHGDFEAKDAIIITQSDYKQFVNGARDKYLWDILKTEFVTRNFLFLGYSLKDSNVLESLLDVEKHLTNNRREHFIVVPDMMKRDSGRLKKHGVEYVQGTAEEFLTTLFEYLEKNAKDDLEKDIQTKENIEFFKQHNMTPTISHGDGKNRVLGVQSLDGNPLASKCHFMLPEKYANQLREINFEKQGIVTKPGDLPHLEIPASEIKDFNYSIGGISFTNREGIQKLLIYPANTQHEVTISVPECEFIKKTTCTTYNNAHLEIIMQVDCGAFFMKVSYKFEDEVSYQMKGGILVELKENYSDNDLAIQWMTALQCVSGVGTLRIQVNGIGSVDLTGFEDEKLKTFYSNCLDYYKNLKRIELGLGVSFDKYENYSLMRYQESIKLVSAISKTPVITHDGNGTIHYTIPKIDVNDDMVRCIKENKPFVGIMTQQTDENVVLCGHSFGPLYAKVLYISCHAVSFKSIDDEQYAVEMRNDNDYNQVWWGFEPFAIGTNPENLLE